MKIRGQCRLCLNEADLRDSHFIPKAAYRLVRGQGTNPHPLVVQTDMVLQTSAQTRAHLLCHECEQRLSRNGENAFFQYCYRGPGKFKLLPLLLSTPPALEDDNGAVYAVPETTAQVIEQIGYFGLSIFWKSSIHAWSDGISTIPSISLGPYQERFRRFLLGQELFPSTAALAVEVSEESNRLIQVVGTPGSLKNATNYVHWVHICGIRFNLVVGQRMPSSLNLFCVFKASPKIIVLSKNQEAEMSSLYRGFLKALVSKSK